MTILTDKTILITGASSGIGLACAQTLAAHGAKLILGARREERLEKLLAILPGDSVSAYLDVSERGSVENFFEALPASHQSIDILINNAGLALTTDPMQVADIDNWITMIDTNLKGLLYMTRHVLPQMIARQSGHIVNIGSVAGQFCYPNGNVYSATKHAVRAITQSLRMDIAGSSVRVTEIAPGAVETEFSEVRWQDKAKAAEFYRDFNPLLASDVADAVAYALTRPAHVNISEITLFPTDQAACSMIHRKNKQNKE